MSSSRRLSGAGLNAIFVLIVQCGRLLFLARLPDYQLVRQVPDDAFYYLEAARNFARLGRWTFDGTEPSSGFHLVWGYALTSLYKVFPGASLHTVFVAGGLLQIACLAVGAFLVTKTAARLAGPYTWVGVLLVFLSAAALLPGTWLMETSFVVLAAALAVFALLRRDSRCPW